MNKAHLPRLFSSFLLLVGFFSTVPAFAYLYACPPSGLFQGTCTPQSVPPEYLTLDSKVLMCTWPTASTALYYQSHSTGPNFNCDGVGTPSYKSLNDQSALTLPLGTDRFTVPIYSSAIGAYIPAPQTTENFSFTQYLNSGDPLNYFSAALMMVVISFATGHALRAVLSMLR
jgi:hypothetical protein